MSFRRHAARFASLALVLMALAVRADEKISVQVILDRNPFALKPPPPQIVQTNEPPKAPDTVKLSGIVSVIGPARALLVRQESGQAKPEYLSLRVGEKDGTVEVVRIDVDVGEVEILNGGARKVLNFKDDGLKPSAPGPNPALTAAIPGLPPGAGTQPPPQPPAGFGAGGSGQTMGRPINAVIPVPTSNASVSPAIPTGAVPVNSSFTREMRIGPGTQGNATLPPPQKVDPAVQQILMQANGTAAPATPGTPPPAPANLNAPPPLPLDND